jgi:hypothetical protein
MEKVIDFDKWIESFVPPIIKYYAIFDRNTSMVIGIYPDHAAAEIDNKLLVENDFAEDVFNGKISLNMCFVDEVEGKLEIIQTKSLRTIDDILHRIIDKKYSRHSFPDVVVRYITAENSMEFELSDRLKEKTIKWSGDTELKFIISSYNDPHKIYQVVNFTLEEIIKSNVKFPYVGTNNDFSVFTPRIFKKYVFEKI